MAESESSLVGSASLFDTNRDSVTVTSEPLSLDAAYKAVHDTSAGAISTFSGITRDNFNGKKAIELLADVESYKRISKAVSKCVKTDETLVEWPAT